ncbi:MAG: hypothetical protein UC961_01660, partial [Emergencia sp.]|nr:hypothetical protein [Emergencia sp.]
MSDIWVKSKIFLRKPLTLTLYKFAIRRMCFLMRHMMQKQAHSAKLKTPWLHRQNTMDRTEP